MGLGHVFQLLVKIITNAHNATTTEPSLKMSEVLNFKDFFFEIFDAFFTKFKINPI